MKKSRWCYIFVAEPIIEVIEILREKGLNIDYDDKIEIPGLAMGHFKGNSGIIQSCDVWLKKERSQILTEIGRETKTCVVLRSISFEFLKISKIVRETLTIIDDVDCEIHDRQEGIK